MRNLEEGLVKLIEEAKDKVSDIFMSDFKVRNEVSG